MPTRNHSGTTQNLRVQYLVANQAWCVVWHDSPISINDRMFFEDLRVLGSHLDTMGLHLQQNGTIERWCPVGRLLRGHEPYLAFLDLCPNHATPESQFCVDHLAHGRQD